MTKTYEFQQFVNKMRGVSDRPSLLMPLFEQGIPIEEARAQLQQLARNQIRMFKGKLDKTQSLPPKRVERIMTVAGARRRVAESALKAFGRMQNIRMTRDCRDWIDSTVAQLRKDLRKGA